MAAGGNPVAQFVGSFRWSITPANGGINLSLTNTTSFRSLTYDIGPQWQRGSFPTPMGEHSSNLQHRCNVPLTMIMKLQLRLAVLIAASCALGACHTAQPPVTPEVLVGSYSYVSKDPASRATDHNLNHLVLQSDGTYHLVEGGTTKAVSEKKGIWRIVPGSPPNVLLDHAGYPIEIRKNEVRLLIDLDTGIWWAKPR